MKIIRGYAAIGLYAPKKGPNVGSALRAAACYQAAMVAIERGRYTRPSSDTTKAYRHIPMIHTDNLRGVIPYDCIPIAVEICKEAKPIFNFVHPERAFYVFGPEDGSIPNHILDWCKYIVFVPTKFCMNLGATVNVVLYDRLMKRSENVYGDH